ANHPDFLVEAASSSDAEVLGQGNLHVLHVVPVPHRFEEGIREAEVEDVLHRLLAEIVVDAEDLLLRKHAVQHAVEPTRGVEIPAERFLDDDPRVAKAAAEIELSDDRFEKTWWNREIMGRPRRVLQLHAQPVERGSVLIVAVDVAEMRDETVAGGGV